MNLTQTTSGGETPEAVEAHRFRWQLAIRRECFRWANEPDQCPHCGERIGHFGGGTERDPCPLIPENCPLEEVRPMCLTVRRHWIGDAIRAACAARGVD